MKNTIRVIAAAAALMCAATPAFAQGGGGGGQMSQADRAAARRAAMFEGITLTPELTAKIDTIMAQTQKASMDLRAGIPQGERPGPEVMQKMQALQAEQLTKIKALLTPEQVTTFDANMAKMPQGRGRGGN